MTNCARNGAVYGCQDPTCAVDTSGIRTAVLRDAANLDSSKMTIVTTRDSTTNPTYVEVTVTYPFSTITNYPGLAGKFSLTRKVRTNVTPWVPN